MHAHILNKSMIWFTVSVYLRKVQVGSGRAKLNRIPDRSVLQPARVESEGFTSDGWNPAPVDTISSLSHDSEGFIHVPFPVWWDMSVSSLDITPPKTDKSPLKRCLEDTPFLLSHVRRGVSSHLGGIEPKNPWKSKHHSLQVGGPWVNNHVKFLGFSSSQRWKNSWFFEMLLDIQSIYTYICHTSILCDMILYLWEMVVFAALGTLSSPRNIKRSDILATPLGGSCQDEVSVVSNPPWTCFSG